MTKLKQCLGLMLGALALGLLAPSCAKDTPVKPIDEGKNKLHEDPFRAEIILQEGRLKAGASFDGKTTLASFEPQGQAQAFIRDEGNPSPSGSVKRFEVKSLKDAPDVVYSLVVKYYNRDGKEITHQFIDNKQDQIHQHFFSWYDGGVRVRDAKRLPYDYRYADTTPWDSPTGAFTGDTNPLGFKGLIRFTKPGVSFDLSVDLMHHPTSKYQRDGKASPFYSPHPSIGSVATWDINIKVPIVIAGTKEEDTPQEPSPQEGKGQAAKAELRIVEGHMHGEYAFHQNLYPKEMKYLPLDRTLVFHFRGGTWVADKENPKQINLLSGKHSTYGLSLRYYDAQGVDITHLYAADEAGKKHQHFFVPANIRATFDGAVVADDSDPAKMMRFVYCDTSPWNKSNKFDKARFTGKENPIGIKGYLRPLRARKQFDLEIRLLAADAPKASSTFHTPAPAQTKVGTWYAAIKVPVLVFMDDEEKGLDLFDELTTIDKVRALKESDVTDKEALKSIHSMMRAYDISFGAVVEELFWNINGSRPDHSDNGFWF